MAAQRRTEIVELLERHGLRPNKRLGQHFLADPNIVDRIVRFSGVGADDSVVEIGTGTGTLTSALAATGARVVTYEVDERLRPVIVEVLEASGVTVRFADATRGETLDGLGPGPWRLVANLPYNVGTPLLLDLLRDRSDIVSYVVMLQREVADRLAAGPGSRKYGLPSVVARLYGEVTFGFAVAPQVFYPAPEVGSAVVRVDRISPHPAARRAEELAVAAFGTRRKMLRRSLRDVLPDPEVVLEAAGIVPTSRAEELSAADFIRMAEAAP
jgi:16S rRNA (adenine1518-N6/adenine1519-N6)-dimethyltransferase